MSKPRMPLTAIILTFNEAKNITRCVGALDRVDEVIIVDSFSSDNTLQLAEQTRKDVKVYRHTFVDFGDQRNWALDQTKPRHKWVLFVDADEYCTDALLSEVAEFLNNPGLAVGAFIAGKTYFLNSWIKHCSLYPSYQLRLLKLGHVRYRKEGHGQREVMDGPARYLKEGWIHNAFGKGVRQWIDRHNAYSTEEANLLMKMQGEPLLWTELLRRDQVRRRRALKRIAARLPARSFLQFAYLYVLRMGFLDGRAGAMFCMLKLANSIHISVKLMENRLRCQPGEYGQVGDGDRDVFY